VAKRLDGSRCHLVQNGGRHRPRPHCVRWEPSSLHEKRHSIPRHFSAKYIAKRLPISATAELNKLHRKRVARNIKQIGYENLQLDHSIKSVLNDERLFDVTLAMVNINRKI